MTLLCIAFVASLQVQPPGDPDPHAIAGWYEAGNIRVLITPGPAGGYRLLDFDGLRFHALEQQSPDSYIITGGGSWKNGRLRVERGASKSAERLHVSVGDISHTLARTREYPFAVEEVRFDSSGTALGGILLVPRTAARPAPGAVVLHGSGDSDRDNVWAFTFAQSLARAGLVVLFADKRGSGASGGNWRATDLRGLADDALAGLALLRADPRVDAGRVGFVGLSQGGVVAPIAAASQPGVAFVVSISGSPVTLFEQMRHEMLQDLRRAEVPPEGVDAVARVGHLAMAYARSGAEDDWSGYEKALAALAAGPFAPGAARFPADRAAWQWKWWRSVGDVDPLPAWKAFGGPRLAIYGLEDEYDNVPVGESVRRLKKIFTPRSRHDTIKEFPQRGHTLVDPDRGWVDLEVLDFLSTWIRAAVSDGGRR